MTDIFYQELNELEQELRSVSKITEVMIDNANLSLRERLPSLAVRVIESDDVVDQKEVNIEQSCLRILANYHPDGDKLRTVTSVMKVNNDLERIADLAVNIAERALQLEKYPRFLIPLRFQRMVDLSVKMLRSSIESFFQKDCEMAEEVCRLDDQVDFFQHEITEELKQLMHLQPELISPAMHCYTATRHIERIADHSTNIAEDVIYLVQGEIVRHRTLVERLQH